MAKLVLKDAFVEVDGVDLSTHARQVAVNMTRPAEDMSGFGTGRDRAHGLEDDSFTVQWLQDFDAGSVDATLWPLYDNESEFTVKVRPTSGAVSSTNPEYSGTVKVFEYVPLDAEVGSRVTPSTTFNAKGKISRATA